MLGKPAGSHKKTKKTTKIEPAQTLTGHEGGVFALAALGDGRVASANDKTIKVWDVTSGRCVQTLTGHRSPVTALVALGDGRVASGSYDETIKVWDVTSGRCAQTLTGHKSFVYALMALGDGRVASGSQDKTIKVWDITSGRCAQTLTGHISFVYALVPLGAGRVASGSQDKTIKVWDVTSGRCERTLTGHTDTVYALVALGDGRVASGSRDGIKVWDATSGRCEQTLTGHTDTVYALVTLGEGRVASGSWDKTIKMWTLSLSPTSSTPHLSLERKAERRSPSLEVKREKEPVPENPLPNQPAQSTQTPAASETKTVARTDEMLSSSEISAVRNLLRMNVASTTKSAQTKKIKAVKKQVTDLTQKVTHFTQMVNYIAEEKIEQHCIDRFKPLQDYQRCLEQELSKFIVAYWLSTTELFQLTTNKKSTALTAAGSVPAAGIFVKIFTPGLEALNKKHRFYQINRLANLFVNLKMIGKVCEQFVRKLTIAKIDKIVANEEEFRTKKEIANNCASFRDKADAFYNEVKKIVKGLFDEWKTKSNMSGVELQPSEWLAILDGAYLLDAILTGEVEVDKNKNLVDQFLNIVGVAVHPSPENVAWEKWLEQATSNYINGLRLPPPALQGLASQENRQGDSKALEFKSSRSSSLVTTTIVASPIFHSTTEGNANAVSNQVPPLAKATASNKPVAAIRKPTG